MRKIVCVLVIIMLLCTCFVLIVDNNFNVEGSSGGNGEEDIGLDYDYIWFNILNNLTYVVHNDSIWGSGDDVIRMGRAFGTKGDKWTAEYIYGELLNLSLENVTIIPLDTINSENYGREIPWKNPEKPWNCNYKIEIVDYNLTFNHPAWEWSEDGHVPKNESFVMPSGMKCWDKSNPDYGNLTYNNSCSNSKIIHKDLNCNILLYGATFDNYMNISIDEVTNTELLFGNVTYLSTGKRLPNDQEGRLFIFDEEEGCEDQLDNVTNAIGVILIHNDTRGNESYSTNTSSYQNISIGRSYISDNNLTSVIDMLENGTTIFAENTNNNEILTFYHNFSHLTWWPQCCGNGFFIIDEFSNWEDIYLCLGIIEFFNAFLQIITGFEFCHGVILYDNYDNVHIMEATSRDWRGWDYNKEINGLYNLTHSNPGLQIFSINKTIGEFLMEHIGEGQNTVSGYLNQTEKYVEAFNVLGNITIDQSPDNKIIILEGRPDAWWGECPGDSGAGVGIIMGIAKYINDTNIKPKYNLTFLFTTGEEYGMRGSWYHSLSHPDDNIIYWIGADQLGFNFEGTGQQTILSNNSTAGDGGIIRAIANETQLVENSGYGFDTKETKDPPSTNEAAFRWRGEIFGKNCSTICISKKGWPFHHRAGNNYIEGDSMKYMDRKDINATFNFTWGIVKYYCFNPDCWFESYSETILDSPDDEDNLNDSIKTTFIVKSTLPHDLVMINATLINSSGVTFNQTFMNFTVNRTGVQESVTLTLPEYAPADNYTLFLELYNSTGKINEIVNITGINYNDTTPDPCYTFLYPFGVPPVISNVSCNPDVIGYGFNVTIQADVYDGNGVDVVKVNIKKPKDIVETQGYDMTHIAGDTYEYVFNNTWQNGQYNYSFYVVDVNGNSNKSTSLFSFNVSVNASIKVCTVKDVYYPEEFVNITDPPANHQLIGYEFLDNNSVLHVWNSFDSYYFNTSNGIQFTNHYNNYWSHNVLMLGYYNNEEWNLVYRVDELSGFNKNIVSDNESFVNITLWKDLSYGGYDFRLAIRYFLGVDDNELTVIPYIKNLGVEIPFVLGFAWELKDIQVDLTSGGDYIEINGTSYYLNQSLNETYNNLTNPCFYIREDFMGNMSESLYLRWDENLNYKIQVKSRTGQYNAPVTLGIKIGTLGVGQEKYTFLFWHDADERIYFFDDYDTGDPGEQWLTNPGYMVDGNENSFASTSVTGDVEFLDGNSCNGEDLGVIGKVELRCRGYNYGLGGMGTKNIILRPVFSGGDGDDHIFITTSSASWSSWFNITDDTNAPVKWDWKEILDLCCDVESNLTSGFTLDCSKVEIRVTYNPYSGPEFSNPYPADGSMGVPITPLLNITVNHPLGSIMNISWYSNSSGSWQVFGVNNSVYNGTYYQLFSNATVNGVWWYWMVNASDGSVYNNSSVFMFYTGNQSKIVNTGVTNFSGYLLMQVDYLEGEEWVLDTEVVDETSTRTVTVDGQLALDTVFNGKVNTNDLNHGSGTYRVYAAFRDPESDVLICDDESLLEAWYEFTVDI